MVDMSATVAPKSDQLNADDLIGGPRTIRIVRVTGTGSSDQPVAVHFEGDEGRPYKPCKSMRRVMIAAWGADASKYVGRSMTLYRDPKVVFGGMEVGGIRISHMSHIERDMVMALTVTKARRSPYTVKPLREEHGTTTEDDRPQVLSPDGDFVRVAPQSWVAAVKKAVASLPTADAVKEWRAKMGPHIGYVAERSSDMATEAERAIEARLAALASDFPGDLPSGSAAA